jgi:chromosome segregation ATPase
VIYIKVNDFFIISAIFLVGIVILGVTAYGLYFQTTSLEKNVSDLNTAFLTAQEQAVALDAQVTQLHTEVASRDNSLSALNTQINDLSSTNYVLQTNYDVGQQDLNNKIIELLEKEDDINILNYELDDLNSNYFDLISDFNIFKSSYDENISSISSDYNFIRDNFKACYWASNCENNYTECLEETDLNMSASDIALLQNAICDAISFSDYNTMMSK